MGHAEAHARQEVILAALEPTQAAFAGKPFGKYLAATRPPFLLAALIAAMIGLATAHQAGIELTVWTAALTLLGAVLVHAAINVINDYHDDRNGTDGYNDERLFPFTGGSRFIQNGVLSAGQTRHYAATLFGVSMLIGLILTWQAGPGLILIGLLGLLIGWAYSAPPLALNSHGWGEFSVAIGFGLLMPLGADFVQRHAFALLPLAAGLPYALLTTNLLLINQFPDRRADERAGKHHWVVRLGARRARWLYPLLVLTAYGSLVAMVGSGLLPHWCLLGIIPLPLSLHASAELLRHAEQPGRLAPAIKSTIGAALAYGVCVSLGLWLA